MVQQRQFSNIKNLKLDEFLRMVDVATTVRQKQEEVNQQFNIDETKTELKKKLLETAQITGEQLTDSQIEIAINSYFDGLYSFKAPERNFGTNLAEIYVDRVRLTKKFVIPPLSVIAAAGLLWLSGLGVHSAHLKSQERSLEKDIESAYQERQILLTEAHEISVSPLISKLPSAEKDKLHTQLSTSQERLKSMAPYFNKYCSNGTAADDITKVNYQEAKNGLPNIEDSLNQAKNEFQDGKSVIDTQEGLILTQRNLETLIGEVRGLKPINIFSQRAENAYSAGLGEIERRNLSEAKQKEQQLLGVKQDISQFSNLTSQTETLYNSIRTISKEKEASEKGEELYNEAKKFISVADVPKLSQTVSHLQDINVILSQEYTLRIVNREGVKSGIDRYYTDENGRRGSGYYLIVEAIDSSGNALEMRIRNEENGQTENATMWGERVPESVYEKVKEDKLDNGIVNNDIIGTKRRGYLKEEITMQGVTKQGEITEW